MANATSSTAAAEASTAAILTRELQWLKYLHISAEVNNSKMRFSMLAAVASIQHCLNTSQLAGCLQDSPPLAAVARVLDIAAAADAHTLLSYISILHVSYVQTEVRYNNQPHMFWELRSASYSQLSGNRLNVISTARATQCTECSCVILHWESHQP